MITSKRDLKKYFDRVQEELAMVVIPAAVYARLYDEEKATEALTKLAALTQEAKNRLSIAFDKSAKAYANVQEYKKARHEYYREAYAKAFADFEQGINELLAPINEAKNTKA